MRPKDKIYFFLSVLSVFSYAWLVFSIMYPSGEITVCMFKHITGLPCPSCGTTRSLLLLVNGDWTIALWTNPLGYLAAVLLIMIPGWIISDWVRRKESFFQFYQKAEEQLRKKIIFIPCLVLLMVNWSWNIVKAL